jgi:MYXO-CTERM domain-containing protein
VRAVRDAVAGRDRYPRRERPLDGRTRNLDPPAEDGFDADTAGRIRRAAVVVHLGKHRDREGFRAVVVKAMADLRWAEPLWLETGSSDTGERLAREAVRSGVDLVIASGGDGTVRDGHSARCAALRHREPAGSEPGRSAEPGWALAVALTGALRRRRRRQRAAVRVMARPGFDAEMVAGVGEGLKTYSGTSTG